MTAFVTDWHRTVRAGLKQKLRVADTTTGKDNGLDRVNRNALRDT